MNNTVLSIAIRVSICIFVLSFSIRAQFGEKVSKTFDNSITSAVAGVLTKNQGNSAVKPKPVVVKFTPSGDSGVIRSLAEALGQNEAQKAGLIEAFQQIKQGYEAEVAKEGKSNNLAAAFTFFIAANVMTYTQSEPPSDQITDELFNDLQAALANLPAFAEMTNAEKQKMHDWLICMGGLSMTNYLDARQTGNSEALANIKTFADYSLQLVLGIKAENLSLSAHGLNIAASNPVPASRPGNSQIVGTWSRKASVGFGTSPGQILTYQGYFIGRYNFNPSGTYTFKSEMWNGYLRSEEWWTTEESGTFSINGNALIISPSKSVSTLRNRAGAVQKTQNNPLQSVSYNWKFHFSEGINETVLVLQSSAETTRDGTFSGHSSFPNSYIYDQTSVIEWKF